jgi:hypothetical protein
LELCDYSA